MTFADLDGVLIGLPLLLPVKLATQLTAQGGNSLRKEAQTQCRELIWKEQYLPIRCDYSTSRTKGGDQQRGPGALLRA